ncbi:IS630 family transposase [Acidihalobacter prosperus]|uniref:Endonuclease n=1 Tax=Acidihalobacter prosperus TaxID=160660 RepID=A0A1A6C730_9GAMM|nr:IS630 family transposase [Acidihalobacter prosperus]OBS10367.1 endonuclease [Acidihalobacter prosperus]
MKNDGRTLTRETLEAMRFMALERMAEGESPAAVSASFGMHRTWAYKVRLKVRGRGQGKRALQLRRAPGRRRKLTDAQGRQVFRWVNGKNPRQYGFDFGLWTRQIVRELIAQRLGVSLSLASVGALLARVGLTAQKPLQRAYQRDPDAIERWQRETYPAIARQAKRDKADIYFWDESGFRADSVHGKTWGAKGHTPVVSVPGQRQGISAASAVSAKGAFWFTTYKGGLNGDLFVTFLQRLMRGRRKPLHLILDNLPAHKTRAVKTYVAKSKGKLTLHFLPGYAPELNPDELVWSHAKRTGNARRPLRAGERLEDRIQFQLADMAAQPNLIRSFSRHPSVAYITDC